MEVVSSIFSILGIIMIAVVMGKLMTKIKLPAILGWLITGMVFGPCLVGLVSQQTLDNQVYKLIIKLLECFVGIMIGSEIKIQKLRKSGAKVLGITFFQSIGTFLFVSLVFAIIFYFVKVPPVLGLVFGGIALATAPAPALAIVRQYKTKGPVTDTLLPLAAIDDLIGIFVFFTVISFVGVMMGGGNVSILDVVLSIMFPLTIGIITGLISGYIFKKIKNKIVIFIVFIVGLLINYGLGLVIDIFYFKSFLMNYMILGMTFSATAINFLDEEKEKNLLKMYNPILSLSIIVVILNLGMPLDYRFIAGASIYTAVYIISRAIGKIGGAYLGGLICRSEPTVKKYLGFTLLPHSGVSLVFTGIAVSTLANTEYASIIQGTIAAAAIINEIIAVIVAKYAFKFAHEIPEDKEDEVSVDVQ